MSLSQIKQVVKENNIKNVSHLNKKELISVLNEKGIAIPERDPRKGSNKVEEDNKVTSNNKRDYSRLKTIRNKPRQVRITDITTGESTLYKSLYSAGKSLNHSSKIVNDYDGKIYKGKFKVEIIPSEEVGRANIDDTCGDANNAEQDNNVCSNQV